MFRFTFGLLLGFGVSFFFKQAPWEGLDPSDLSRQLQLEKLIDKAKEDVLETLKIEDVEKK